MEETLPEPSVEQGEKRQVTEPESHKEEEEPQRVEQPRKKTALEEQSAPAEPRVKPKRGQGRPSVQGTQGARQRSRSRPPLPTSTREEVALEPR
jgi:hypothetical protein